MGRRKPGLLALVLVLSTLLAGCDESGGGAGGGTMDPGTAPAHSSEPAPQSTGAQGALVDQWAQCLAVNEAVLSLSDWAFDYAGRYARSNSWNDLLMARAAAETALAALKGVSLPEPVLSKQDYNELMEQGIEADVVKLERDKLPNAVEHTVITLEVLWWQLYEDIYFKSGLENLEQLVKLDRETVELTAAYLADTTNYLLLQVEDRSLWDRMRDEYPWLSRQRGRWTEDPRALEESASEALDGLEAVNTGLGECIGASKYALYLVDEAVETGSLDKLRPEMNVVRGAKSVFPLPRWVDDSSTYLYGFSAGGETVALAPEQDDFDGPEFCVIKTQGVARRDVEDYLNHLQEFGFQTQMEWNPEKKELYARVIGKSEMVVK